MEELGTCLMVAVLLVLLLFHHVITLFIFVERDIAILAELSERYQRLEVMLESNWIMWHAKLLLSFRISMPLVHTKRCLQDV